MKLKDSLVSVILPVYNAEKHLKECLQSLLSQNYPFIQIIAIDDHSKDNSFKILKQFQKQYKGLEVSRNKKRYGPAICYNRALKSARGRFIAFMNPSDINAISRLKRQVNFLQRNPRTVAVGTQYTGIDETSRKLERSNMPQENDTIYDTMIQASSLHPETIMVDRTLLPKDLLYFRSNKYPFIFTEVFVKFFQYGKVANIAQSLYFHREGVKRYGRKVSTFRTILTMIKLWFTSRQYYNYRPNLRIIFPNLIKGI